MVYKKDVIQAINCLKEDMELLRDGSWIPDDHSIDASVDNLELIETYLNQ
jgi:hypothetical protein